MRARDRAQAELNETSVRREEAETQLADFQSRLSRAAVAKQELTDRLALWRSAARRAMAVTGGPFSPLRGH